ncbi:DNA replication/repair protein RecF [Patescibacteria group bacterium]
MIIQKLKLSKFRNQKSKLFNFSPEITVFLGPNASGKTNILEAIHFLSTGKSFRARVEEEVINYNSDISRVKGRIKLGSETMDLEAILTRGTINIGAQRPEKVAKKKLLVDSNPKRLLDFAGRFKIVLFGPEDLELVVDSPTLRRRFLDTVLSQVDREYRRALLSYEKGLRQRNKLLLRIRDEGLSRSQLLFWDKLLIKNGDYLTIKRAEFIEYANQSSSIDSLVFMLDYDKSAISEGRLEQYAEEEVSAATTLVGPHRDDFTFKIVTNGKKYDRDLSRFGSRGEQRMGILWLKLVELSFIEEKTNEKPVLLLDDIFSELDKKHRKIVIKKAKDQQTIITTADKHFLEGFKNIEKIELKI